MVATTISHPKTYEDFLKTPDDGQRYELIDGEIFVSPSPILLHQMAVAELFALLRAFVTERGLGKVILSPMDVRLDEDIVVQPDLCFVGKDSTAQTPLQGWITGSPDLMIEVLSPSNPGYDLVRKRELYARYGIAEYWIIDPIRHSFTALTLSGGRYVEIRPAKGVLKSKALVGFELNLSAFFESIFS